jgi:hypothetical protein
MFALFLYILAGLCFIWGYNQESFIGSAFALIGFVVLIGLGTLEANRKDLL